MDRPTPAPRRRGTPGQDPARAVWPSGRRAAGLIALLLVASWGLAGCLQRPAVDAAQIPHTEIPKADATLEVAFDGPGTRYRGTVADAATRDALLGQLGAAYGTAARGEIVVEPDTNPPPWINGLGPMLAAFRIPGAVLEFGGNRVRLRGTASDEDRANLLKAARRLYPGSEFDGLFAGVDMKHALPDAGDTRALVDFLNALPIGFEDDSGLVTGASQDAFARGARALKAAGRGVRLEAGVYAEPGESEDAGLAVAAQRAEAVRLQLAIRGANPLLIQPRVLPADKDSAGRVRFAALPDAPPTPTGTQGDAGAGATADLPTAQAPAPSAPPGAPPATSGRH